MPAAAFAVSGHARAVSSWLNLVVRLVVGADDQLAAAWHPSRRPGVGGSIRDWVELCGAVLGQANRDPAETPVASGTFFHLRILGEANLQLKSAPWCPRVPLAPSARGG